MIQSLIYFDYDKDFRTIGLARKAWNKLRRAKYKVSFISRGLSLIKSTKQIEIVKFKWDWSFLNKLVISPNNPVYLGFIVVVDILYISSFFVIPFIVSTQLVFFDNIRIYELMADCVLFIDMMLKFFVAYPTDFGMIWELKSIMQHYLSNQWFLDCCSILPGLLTYESYPNVYYLKLVRMLQLKVFPKRIAELIGYTSECFCVINKQRCQVIGSVIKSIIFLLLSVHMTT